MTFAKTGLLACLVVLLRPAQGQNVTDKLKYVDQLIGSANGGMCFARRVYDIQITWLGNVFAGATLPYGMAKAVADVDSESNQGGFTSDANGNVTGFSTMHDSGTGESNLQQFVPAT